jgi:hypothetical protein
MNFEILQRIYMHFLVKFLFKFKNFLLHQYQTPFLKLWISNMYMVFQVVVLVFYFEHNDH